MAQVNSYPILVNAQDFDSLEKVEKINTIVKSQYNTFIEKTNQKKGKSDKLKNIVRSTSNLVSNIRDYNYGNYNFISMFFSTSSMEPDTIYPVLKIKDGYVPTAGGVKPEISFAGVDIKETWNIMLNNYGLFIFTYNKYEHEQQISFKTFSKKELQDNIGQSTIPSKGWYVSMNFFYKLDEENIDL